MEVNKIFFIGKVVDDVVVQDELVYQTTEDFQFIEHILERLNYTEMYIGEDTDVRYFNLTESSFLSYLIFVTQKSTLKEATKLIYGIGHYEKLCKKLEELRIDLSTQSVFLELRVVR